MILAQNNITVCEGKKMIDFIKYSYVGKWVRSQWVPLQESKNLTAFGYMLLAACTLIINAVTILFWAIVYMWCIIITIISTSVFTLGFCAYKLMWKNTEEKFLDSAKYTLNMFWFNFRPELPCVWTGRDKK